MAYAPDSEASVATFRRQNLSGPCPRRILPDAEGTLDRGFAPGVKEKEKKDQGEGNSRAQPEHIDWCSQLRSIPFKKSSKAVIPYLDKAQMDALLAVPDRKTAQGRRDHAWWLFLYHSGTRAQEAAQLLVRELNLGGRSVQIRGKGGQERHCPLWQSTVEGLAPLVANRSPEACVFLNRCGHPVTRFGIHTLVERYARQAQVTMPSLAGMRISPHTIRHTTATHLLRAGVDINTIRAWLGHVSLDTTNIYAEIDLEVKGKALAKCEVTPTSTTNRHWRDDPGVDDVLTRAVNGEWLCGAQSCRPIDQQGVVGWAPHNSGGHITILCSAPHNMREIRSYGSVRGVLGNRHPYRDSANS